MYVELKSQDGGSGPASIGWVTFSKSGRSVYYRGRRLQRLRGGGVSGNFADAETGDEYCVSGVKKNKEDRHWAASGPGPIADDALSEYNRIVTS